MFSTECCRELTIESGSSGAESHFAGFHGHYEFKFKKANLVQIKKGFFVYKKTRKAKYIFKSQDGIWMVRYFDLSFCYYISQLDIMCRIKIFHIRLVPNQMVPLSLPWTVTTPVPRTAPKITLFAWSMSKIPQRLLM